MTPPSDLSCLVFLFIMPSISSFFHFPFIASTLFSSYRQSMVSTHSSTGFPTCTFSPQMLHESFHPLTYQTYPTPISTLHSKLTSQPLSTSSLQAHSLFRLCDACHLIQCSLHHLSNQKDFATAASPHLPRQRRKYQHERDSYW